MYIDCEHKTTTKEKVFKTKEDEQKGWERRARKESIVNNTKYSATQDSNVIDCSKDLAITNWWPLQRCLQSFAKPEPLGPD